MGDWSARSGGAGGGGVGGHGQYAYPQLIATNYTSWSIRVQAIMEDQGVWEVVESPEGTSETQTAAQSGKDKKARAHLLQCLPDDLVMQVAKKKTGKEVWDCLKSRFVSAKHVNEAWLQMLKSEFA